MSINAMSLESAMDLLASNCPHVFSPIATEIQNLRSENEELSLKLTTTQNALNDLIFNTLNGGL